jgi:hypothetical protein
MLPAHRVSNPLFDLDSYAKKVYSANRALGI